MTGKVICCAQDADLEAIHDLMRENQIRRIAVVDEAGAIQGIVSMSDLVNRGRLASGAARETLKSISRPTSEASRPRAESAGAAR